MLSVSPCPRTAARGRGPGRQGAAWRRQPPRQTASSSHPCARSAARTKSANPCTRGRAGRRSNAARGAGPGRSRRSRRNAGP
eukprot:2558345-Lingulodinium_polyedra.AAC.1